MYKTEVKEALPIVEQALSALLAAVTSKGRIAANLRNAVDLTKVHAERLLLYDEIGWWLDGCFELARQAGISRAALGSVRVYINEFRALSAGAITIKNALMQFCLATEGRIMADMTFRSRWEVDNLKIEMNEAFPPVEEVVADSMDSMTYRAIIILRAAIVNYLVETARPMPRMLQFRFANVMPSLVMSHRLYGTAARADELRYENRIVHPAFMQKNGRALSR